MNIKYWISVLVLSSVTSVAAAQTVSVEITNLTQGIYFTPMLVSVHPDSNRFFEVGTTATAELQAMAEGGDIADLEALATNWGAVSSSDPASGMLPPGATAVVESLEVGENDRLSIVAMLLPTNDGFVGLDSWPIPSEPGSYIFTINAYDAGTEANNELIVADSGTPGVLGIPSNPGDNSGTGGTGVTTTENNTTVHIHRGNLGDSMPGEGPSDLDSTIHRWLNPVAEVVVTIQ